MGIGRDAPRLAAGDLDESPQELPGRVRVALLTQPRIEECPIAVDSPIQGAPAARDLHGGLIDGPGDAGVASALGPGGSARSGAKRHSQFRIVSGVTS